MSNKKTSRFLDTWDAVYELLEAQPWTPHPRSAQVPKVWYGDLEEPKSEAIIVSSIPSSDSAPTFATMGSSVSHDEEFGFRVIVGSKVDGCPVDVVRTRQRELLDIVQAAFRSPLTGRPAGDFSTTVPGVQWWRVSRVTSQVYALPDGGFGFYAEVDLLFKAHI